MQLLPLKYNVNHYYIANNNERPYWVFLMNPEIPIESLISYNSEQFV